MRVFVPSFGRAGHASTMDRLREAVAVVPESQASEYEQHYPGRVVAIRDSDDGSVPKKRNAVLRLMEKRELAWMLDDDLKRVTWLKHGAVDDLDELLERHWALMQSAGADFGGFGVSSDPVKYTEHAPFSLTKPSYAAVCIRNIGIAYDESLGRFEDMDFFLRYLSRRRRVLRDNRYFFEFECNKGKSDKKQVGGIEGNDHAHEDAKQILVRRWGRAIKLKSGLVAGINVPIKGV